jgi:hypothetical protein
VSEPAPTGVREPAPETFLSGESGEVSGARLRVTRGLADLALGALEQARGTARRVERLAAATPPRRILVVGVYRPGSKMPAARESLSSRRHEVTVALGATSQAEPRLAADTVAERLEGGKFENLNRVLAEAPPSGDFHWTLVADDDVALPPGFLDGLVALCESFELDLAQPAQTRRSHAAWRVTRRRAASIVRQTRFVEIGPVTAFRRPAAAELLPFPEVRFGWGLDLHWAALAGERGWRCGIVDALPVRHESAPVATAYGREEAVEEGKRFLAGRPYLTSDAAQETVATHRRVPKP